MIDTLQQAQQALHAAAPLIQHLVRVSYFGETDHARRAIDLGVDGLGGDQLADVLLRLLLVQVKKLSQPGHLDARVVFGNDADVVLDDAFAQILPAGVGFGVEGGGSVRGRGREDVGAAEVGAEAFRDDGPSHEFGNGEQFEEGGVRREEAVAGVGMDAVEEVGLLVVVRGEDYVVNYTLEDLKREISWVLDVICGEGTNGVELLGVFFDGFGVEDLAVMFADFEVFVVVFGKGDLLLIVAEFEVRHVVFFFKGRIINAPILFFFLTFFVGLFYLFWRLFRFPSKILGADLPAQNTCLRPVTLFDAERDLFEYELRLLSSLH